MFFLSGRKSSSSVLHFISVLWQNKLPNACMQRTFPSPYLVTLGLWCEYIKLAESKKMTFPIACSYIICSCSPHPSSLANEFCCKSEFYHQTSPLPHFSSVLEYHRPAQCSAVLWPPFRKLNKWITQYIGLTIVELAKADVLVSILQLCKWNICTQRI